MNDKQKALEILYFNLRSKDRDKQTEALNLLDEIDETESIPILLKALEDTFAKQSIIVSEALVKVGRPAVPHLIELLESEKSVRWKVPKILGIIGDNQAVPALEKALSDEWSHVREDAVWALGAIGDEGAVIALSQATRDKIDSVGYEAILALEKIGTEQALNSVADALIDDKCDDAVREIAAEVLGRSKNPKFVPYLLKTVFVGGGKYHHGTMLTAWNAVEEMGEEAIPELSKILQAHDEDMHTAAIAALKQIGTTESLQVVEEWKRSTYFGDAA